MTAPPGAVRATRAHRRPEVSANAAHAAAAIRRAGRKPTPGLLRMVIRGWRDRGRPDVESDEWWDALVRELPYVAPKAMKRSALERERRFGIA